MDLANKLIVGLLILLFVAIFSYGFLVDQLMLKTCQDKGFSEVVSIRDSKYCKVDDQVLGVGCGGAIFMIQCGLGSQVESFQEVQGRIQ